MDSIFERIDSFNENNLDYMQFYSSDIKIDYEDILKVWYNYLEKIYFNNNKIIDFNDENVKSILKITILEPILAELLDKFFIQHIYHSDDDLLLIYIKGCDKVLLLYKSYIPLLTSNEIKLPFWELLVDSKDICDKLKDEFEDEENICLMSYSS